MSPNIDSDAVNGVRSMRNYLIRQRKNALAWAIAAAIAVVVIIVDLFLIGARPFGLPPYIFPTICALCAAFALYFCIKYIKRFKNLNQEIQKLPQHPTTPL